MTSEKKFSILFWSFAACLMIGMPLLSRDFGITWDEWVHSHYGKLTWRYFLSLGTDRSCLTSGAGMGDFRLQYYGHLFDTFATLIYGLVRGSLHQAVFEDVSWDRFYETKHAVNAVVGCWAMIVTGLVAKQIGGARSGFIAILLIATTPLFFGHSMNNPKDIPFAGAYILGIWFLIRYFSEFPNTKRFTLWGFAAAIAIAINIRIAGLLLIVYFILFGIVRFITTSKQSLRRQLLIDIVKISVIGYFGGLILWPYGHQNPFVNPWLALQEMSRYQLKLGNLFMGETVLSTEVPWYYVPKWISITVPFSVLIGFCGAVALIFVQKFRISFGKFNLGILFFSVFFPISYAIIAHSAFYDSWRHSLFIYPSLIVLAAILWEFLLRIAPRAGQVVCALALSVLVFQPIKWMVKNHPHEYVYFNETVGGLDGAFSNYDTDYWGNSLRMGAEWLGGYLKEQKVEGPVIVSADGSLIQTAYYLRKYLGDQYIPFNPTRDRDHWWDYGLVLSRNWRKKDLLSGAWPPPGTIHEIKADHTVLCAVVKVIDFYIKNKDSTFEGR